MRDDQGSGRTVAMILGAFTVTFGVMLLLRNLGLVPGHYIMFGPLLFVVAGVGCILLSHRDTGTVWGFALLGFGVYLGLDRLGIAPVPLSRIWPAFLIAAGGALLWQAWHGAGRSPGGNAVSTLNEFAIFGGVNRRFNCRDFRGGEVFAIFGGHEIDLRNASTHLPEVVIEANVIFGGLVFQVPTDWAVAVQGVAIFGAYEDKTLAPKLDLGVEPAKLTIRGAAVFGGVEVKN